MKRAIDTLRSAVQIETATKYSIVGFAKVGSTSMTEVVSKGTITKPINHEMGFKDVEISEVNALVASKVNGAGFNYAAAWICAKDYLRIGVNVLGCAGTISVPISKRRTNSDLIEKYRTA